MWLLGFWLPELNLPSEVPAVQAQAPQLQTAEKSGLKVTFAEQEYNFETRRTFFRGQVKAEYEQTVLEANELEISEDTREGWARGGVKLTDPEGNLTADDLYFRWRRAGDPEFPKDVLTGSAKNLHFRSGNVFITGESFEIRGGIWTILNGTGSLTKRSKPEWLFKARKVSMTPGVGGVAEHVFLETLGVRLGPLPRYSFSLNPRIESRFTLPTYSKDENGRYGLAWGHIRPLTENSVLRGNFSAFPSQPASWNLSYAFSPLSSSKTIARVGAPSDLSERFDDGWMNNISVIGPDKEADDFRAERTNVQIQTDWNSGVSARLESPNAIVRAFDAAIEKGEALGSFGLRYTTRLQYVRQDPKESFRPRSVFQGTLQSPRAHLGGGLSTVARLDGFTTLSSETGYGWLRGEADLIYQPIKEVRLGAAYVHGVDLGNPDYQYDRLYSDQGVHLRADLQSGPFTLRYLWKYDFDRGLIYDREYEAAYVAGAFEPFVQYRQFPGSYQFGIRFRMDNFVNRLVSREQKRHPERTRLEKESSKKR